PLGVEARFQVLHFEKSGHTLSARVPCNCHGPCSAATRSSRRPRCRPSHAPGQLPGRATANDVSSKIPPIPPSIWEDVSYRNGLSYQRVFWTPRGFAKVRLSTCTGKFAI